MKILINKLSIIYHMIFQKSNPGFLYLVISISFLACSITTKKVKNPFYIKDTKSLSRDVNSVINTQEIDVNGVESMTNGKSTSELTIGLINAEDIPSDSAISNMMLEHVAILVKQALKDTGEYTSYTVLFVNHVENGAVTTTTSNGRTFQSKEIRPYFHMVNLGDRFDSLAFLAKGKSVFSRQDSEVVSSLTYFDHRTDLTGQLKIYKQTDSGDILIITRELGTFEPAYKYSVYKLKINNFYETPKLGSGAYRIEYIMKDSIVGTRTFKLL
jgi:hypothetical protein